MIILGTKLTTKSAESVEDLFHGRIHFIIFQSMVLGPERQRICHRLESLLYLQTFINIKETEAFKKLATALKQDMLYIAGHH